MNYLDNIFDKVSHWHEEFYVSEATIIKLLELCTTYGEPSDWDKLKPHAISSVVLKVKERDEKFPAITLWKIDGSDKFLIDQIATPSLVLVDIPPEIQFVIFLETRNQ